MSIINDPVFNASAPVLTSRFGFPVREDVALTNAKGETKPAIEKAFQKLVSKISAPLSRILEQGETVFLATQAVPPIHPLEQLTLGWMMYAYYNVTLVVTDRRLLIFSVTSGSAWRGTVRQVRWNQVSKLKAAGLFSVNLSFKVGKKSYSFLRLRAKNAKTLKTLIPLLVAANPVGVEDPLAAIESLCPRCVRPLTPRVYTCASCAMVFKNEKTLALRSLIPGGAYFYVGMTGMGVLVGLVECLFLLALVGTLLDPTIAGKDPGAAGIVAGYYLFLIGLEKLLGYFHARRFVREFEPVKIADVTIPVTLGASAH